ncbi:MAG: DUF2256 domain-containing protein [Halioglobus sp.]
MSTNPSKGRKRSCRPTSFKQSKVCPVCRLSFNNRKKWQQRGQWEQIIYCSARCRARGS